MMKKLIALYLTSLLLTVEVFSTEVEKLVILGGGPAGLTCALFTAQAHLSPLIIEGNHDGQFSSIYQIENYPGFPEGISGEELAKRIKLQAEKFGARFCPNAIVSVDLLSYPFKLNFQNGEELYCEGLVVAMGASPKWLGLESEKALIGHGVSANALLDAPQFEGKNVCVSGGGDSAMEQALLLAEYANQVTLFYRGDRLVASPYLQERVDSHPKIKVCLQTIITEILGENNVTGVIVRNVKTHEENVLQLDGVFISNGRKPNTEMFEGQLEITDKGYIITQDPSSQTSREGVFAAGDITHTTYRKVTTAVGSGCVSALDVIKYFSTRN